MRLMEIIAKASTRYFHEVISEYFAVVLKKCKYILKTKYKYVIIYLYIQVKNLKET
jgi:hypothetical protein